jgi:RNA polymerase sigma-70 factor, ECF subfamily
VPDQVAARLDDLETLYRERLASFVRFAAAVCGGEQEGRDAVQDAFAQAILRIDDFRGEGPLEAWVWRIVVNAARAARRRPTALPAPDADVEVSAGNGHASDNDERVRGWVTGLPERQRLAVFLRYFADLDYASIAVVLGVEIGTVSASLSAAHASLRRSHQEARG